MAVNEPLSLDALIAIDSLLTDEERMIRDSVRRFVRERYLPRAADLFAKEEFPTDLIPRSRRWASSAARSRGTAARG
jgi:glutaryl-CoA dehydrogenase